MNKSPDIPIIYEDNHLLVVEKPVNIPSQLDRSNDMDLLTMLKKYIKVKYNKPGNVYLGLVHRLDRPVGGVMVFARTSKAASRLSNQMRIGEFKKSYLAVICGNLDKPSGRLVHYLLKDSKINKVSIVNSNTNGAKKAVLDYECIDHVNNLTLVKINLHTGRPHQIRVQFAGIGHPLYGDHKYGLEFSRMGQQIALWSNEIEITHPTLRRRMNFRSNPPCVDPWNRFVLLLDK